MDLAHLFPDRPELTLLRAVFIGGSIELAVATAQSNAACPACGVRSARVHSRYTRQVLDLPWAERAVHIALRVRRFFCDEAACERRVFGERLPGFLEAFRRRTLRLEDALTWLGLALGGRAGARIAAKMKMPAGDDSVLRLVKNLELPREEALRVVGIDDWAWKKGRAYVTIVVDLQRRRVVDVLGDRSAKNIAEWLRAHPTIEIIARDHGGAYVEGAARGAPNAKHVADRWYLLANLTDTMKGGVDRRWPAIRESFKAILNTEAPAPEPEGPPPIWAVGHEKQASQASRNRRLDRYD